MPVVDDQNNWKSHEAVFRVASAIYGKKSKRQCVVQYLKEGGDHAGAVVLGLTFLGVAFRYFILLRLAPLVSPSSIFLRFKLPTLYWNIFQTKIYNLNFHCPPPSV